MSRLARENPEDERYQSLEGQREIYADLSDLRDGTECRNCEGRGKWTEEKNGAVVTFTCPICEGKG